MCDRWLRDGLLLAAAMCLLVWALPSRADTEHDGAVWIVNQAALPLDDRFSLHGMVQNRWTRDADRYQRTVLRPWLAMDLPHGFEAALGYDAHVFESPSSVTEQRAWQRIAYRHDFGAFQGTTHLWLEERFFRDESVAFRLRWSFGGAVALPYDTTLEARNELFFNLNPTSRIRARKLGEDQLVVALQRPLVEGVRLDVGYLMQFLDGRTDLFNHFFMVGFAVTTPALGELVGTRGN